MKTLKKILLIPLFAIVCMFARIDSAAAIDYPFSVTTSSIAVDGTFQFKLSAQGTFYVDCGTGGTLSSDDSTANGMISGGTINKTNTTEYIFKCTYSSAGTKTIRFGGTATQYNTSEYTSAIRFNIVGTDYGGSYCANAQLITSISGDLSLVFPYISSSSGFSPRFYHTFYGATHLASVPETLFSHLTGSTSRMFNQTFRDCTGLTSIPGNLFSFGGNNVSGQEFMFNSTFAYTGITSIPENLFVHVTSVATSLFNSTFANSSITSIPENLFVHITSVARDLYANTFEGCTGLTSLPTHLFAHITSTAINMFRNTFKDCTGLTGYIPPTLFTGLVANGSPYSTSDSGMMYEIFYNTGSLATTCPSGTSQYMTGYESYWNGHVSCRSSVPVTLTYACGDGSGTAPTDSNSPYLSGATVTTLSNTCTSPSGLAFDKWNCGGTNVNVGSTFTILDNTTCTAQYTVPGAIGLNWYDNETLLAGPMSCTVGGVFLPPTPPDRTGFVFNGWKIKKQKCGISGLNTNTDGTNYGFVRFNGNSGHNESKYGLTMNGDQWAAEFGYGVVYGVARCSSTAGNNSNVTWPSNSQSDWLKENPADDNGRYCWCQVTGFTSKSDDYTSGSHCKINPRSSKWLFRYDCSYQSECLQSCANHCAYCARSQAAGRTGMFIASEQ